MKRDASLALSLLIVILGLVTFYFQHQSAELRTELDALAPVKKRNVELEAKVTTLDGRLTNIRVKEIEPLQKQLDKATAALKLANRKLTAKEKDCSNLLRLFDATKGKGVSAKDLSMLTQPEALPSESGVDALLAPGETPRYLTPYSSGVVSSYSSGSVSVRGYYRKNGTYVQAHTRRH